MMQAKPQNIFSKDPITLATLAATLLTVPIGVGCYPSNERSAVSPAQVPHSDRTASTSSISFSEHAAQFLDQRPEVFEFEVDGILPTFSPTRDLFRLKTEEPIHLQIRSALFHPPGVTVRQWVSLFDGELLGGEAHRVGVIGFRNFHKQDIGVVLGPEALSTFNQINRSVFQLFSDNPARGLLLLSRLNTAHLTERAQFVTKLTTALGIESDKVKVTSDLYSPSEKSGTISITTNDNVENPALVASITFSRWSGILSDHTIFEGVVVYPTWEKLNIKGYVLFEGYLPMTTSALSTEKDIFKNRPIPKLE